MRGNFAGGRIGRKGDNIIGHVAHARVDQFEVNPGRQGLRDCRIALARRIGPPFNKLARPHFSHAPCHDK